jgi:hypothetical protein
MYRAAGTASYMKVTEWPDVIVAIMASPANSAPWPRFANGP